MPSRQGSIIRRRILARELRQLRDDRGLGLAEAATALDISISTLSRIETARQPVSVHLVRSMLDLYDTGDRWDELVELARAARKPAWWHAYGLGNNSYIGYEAEAVRVHEFTPSMVPGLLQTAAYARALFTAVPLGRTPAQLETDLAIRIHRKRRLTSTDDPLELICVIDETALLRPVGGPTVMREQLHHLAEAAEFERVTVRVLPNAVGAHGGLASGFAVLNFGDLGEPDLVYVEHALGAVLLDQDGDASRAKLVFDAVDAAASSPADSLAFIRRLAVETRNGT